MPAVMEATRNTFDDIVRPQTPARLRLWTGLVIGAAGTLLLSLALVMSQVQEQVRIIGTEATPRAVAAADLYFALSDLDAQVTRMLLAGDADETASSRIDALARYKERGRQADADLRALTSPDAAVAGIYVVDLTDGLAVYRQRVGQAMTAQELAGGEQPAGRPAAGALGHYTQATNLLHQRLLPDAQKLLDESRRELDEAYADKRSTESAATAVAVLLGGTLLALLVFLQVWLARRFRRLLNPALLTATGLSLLLLVTSALVLGAQERRLAEARDAGLTPYLELARLRAVGYDASADTSRYLVSANLDRYRKDFDAKAATLAGGVGRVAGPEAERRWQAYQKVHERITGLADRGRTAEAVGALTGIRRGDAAFDFAYYDAAVAAAGEDRRAGFDRALRTAELTLTGWVTLPVVTFVLVALLVLAGVRKRLAEYR
ncbi:hypothetical protein AB0F81_36970 [Actinoplanes sp. NPDC024001]|uniref:hypothetical protein n=1 Tax=Actinoplanes sp. NPDC024001 TaxID=3154598 RepID=UPI0033C482DD